MLRTCVNSWVFAPQTSFAEMARRCGALRIAGLELAVTADGVLPLDAGTAQCEALRAAGQAHGVTIPTLTTNLFLEYHLASRNPQHRELAGRIVLAMLDLAVAVDAPVIQVIPAVVQHRPANPHRTSYEQALSCAFEGLLALVPEAEKRGVRIAIRTVADRFVLSPLEMRELVDRLNSSCVGVSLHLDQVRRIGCPAEWIRMLGHRVLRIAWGFLPGMGGLPGRSFATPADRAGVISAIQEVGYEGPLTFHGSGALRDIAGYLAAWAGELEPR